MQHLINSIQSLFCGSKASMTTKNEHSITANLSNQPELIPTVIKTPGCQSEQQKSKKDLLSNDVIINDLQVFKDGRESFTTQASNLFIKYEQNAFGGKSKELNLPQDRDNMMKKQRNLSIQSRQLETTLKQAQYLLGKPMKPCHKPSHSGNVIFNIDSLHQTLDQGVFTTFIGKQDSGSKDISSIQAVSFQNSNIAEQLYSTEDNCQQTNKQIDPQYSSSNLKIIIKPDVSLGANLISPSAQSQFTFSPKFFKPTQNVLIQNQKTSQNTVKSNKLALPSKINITHKLNTLKLKPVPKQQIKKIRI